MLHAFWAKEFGNNLLLCPVFGQEQCTCSCIFHFFFKFKTLLQHYPLYNTWSVVTRDWTGERFYCGLRLRVTFESCPCRVCEFVPKYIQRLHSCFPGNGLGILLLGRRSDRGIPAESSPSRYIVAVIAMHTAIPFKLFRGLSVILWAVLALMAELIMPDCHPRWWLVKMPCNVLFWKARIHGHACWCWLITT